MTSEMYGVTSEMYGVTSEMYGVTSEMYGVTSEMYGVTSEMYGDGRPVDQTCDAHDQRHTRLRCVNNQLNVPGGYFNTRR